MIDKLEERMPMYDIYDGEKVIVGERSPSNKEITDKINEIIEYINKKESIHYLF